MNADGQKHHTLRKEYWLGMQTGDLECTTCGGSWAPDDSDRGGNCPAK